MDNWRQLLTVVSRVPLGPVIGTRLGIEYASAYMETLECGCSREVRVATSGRAGPNYIRVRSAPPALWRPNRRECPIHSRGHNRLAQRVFAKAMQLALKRRAKERGLSYP